MESLRFKGNIWCFKWENPFMIMSQVLRGITGTAACYKHHWNFERCPPAVDLDELRQISSSVDHCITLLYGESSKAIELEEQGECRLVVVIVPKASGTDLILYYIYYIHSTHMCIPKHTYAALWWGIGDALCPSASELRPSPRDGSLHHGTGIPNYPIENHQVEYEFSISICHPRLPHGKSW